MTENSPGEHDHHAASLDAALAESQRLERAERNADIARQQNTDNRIVRALTEE